MQPYLHLTAGSFGLVTGAEMEMHLYDGLGHRGLCVPLPSTGSRAVYCHPLGLPTREERLRRLGWQQEKGNLRTGYLRLSLDSRLEGGWVKQAELCEAPAESPAGLRLEDGADDLCIAMPWRSAGINVLRSTWNSILVGTQDGFLHAFDGRGKLQRTFQVGEAAVTEILLDDGGLRAACCAGEITFFERGQISGSTVLPEYFVDLAGSGEFVLAWRWKSVWLLDQTGTVRWAAEVRRPIHSCWGNGGGFCLLAGQLLSLRRTHAV
jgi:hypothetical protein